MGMYLVVLKELNIVSIWSYHPFQRFRNLDGQGAVNFQSSVFVEQVLDRMATPTGSWQMANTFDASDRLIDGTRRTSWFFSHITSPSRDKRGFLLLMMRRQQAECRQTQHNSGAAECKSINLW
jgi:hypothetical protein